jgi:hypothetical protein
MAILDHPLQRAAGETKVQSMKRKPKKANSHPIVRRLETESTVIKIGLLIVLVSAVILSYQFYINLGDGDQRAQALGNVVGGAAGAFGAYLVARWQFNAHVQDRRADRAILASATFNSVRDRYDALEQLVDRLEPLHAQGPNGVIVGIGAMQLNALQFDIVAVEPSIRAVISAQFPYESLAIHEMDLALVRARAHFEACWYSLQARKKLEAEEHLKEGFLDLQVAAEQWELVVEGCWPEPVNSPG